jgi:capsular exopolysaccharide synthesis family protein
MDGPRIGAAIAFDRVVPQSWKVSLPALPALDEQGLVVEEFRSLRSRLYQARQEAALKTILITSGVPNEGKSFVAANLAVALARNGTNRTLLIDGDVRRSTLHGLLGAPNTPGLSDYLSGTADLDRILQREDTSRLAGGARSSLANLSFIPAGPAGSNSPELVANRRFDELIAEVAPYFDWIVIDSPPVLVVTDAVELAHPADGVLLVAREGRTSYEAVQRAQTIFRNKRILGVVLNDAKESRRNSSQYGYYYGGPDAEKHAKDPRGKRRDR